ncbi:hypothetical protein GCM10027290_24730 [Micromonospora sonneratiae]
MPGCLASGEGDPEGNPPFEVGGRHDGSPGTAGGELDGWQCRPCHDLAGVAARADPTGSARILRPSGLAQGEGEVVRDQADLPTPGTVAT